MKILMRILQRQLDLHRVPPREPSAALDQEPSTKSRITSAKNENIKCYVKSEYQEHSTRNYTRTVAAWSVLLSRHLEMGELDKEGPLAPLQEEQHPKPKIWYKIIKKLGWGHFSTLWLCHD